VDKKSIGPAYIEVAKRYEKERNSLKTLTDKVIKGGGGNWGEQAMAAHPQHKPEEVEEMVKYILSLSRKRVIDKKPLKSSYVTQAKQKDGSYIFTASYTDKGNGAMGPLTSSKTVALRPAKIPANTLDEGKGYVKFKTPGGPEVVLGSSNGSYIVFDDIDLTDISTMSISVVSNERTAGGMLEAHLDTPDGVKIAEADVASSGTVNLTVKAPVDNKMHKVVFVFKNPSANGKPLFAIDSIEFKENAM
jgi:cytochrome c